MIEKLLALAPHYITDENEIRRLLKSLRSYNDMFPVNIPPSKWGYYVNWQVKKVWEEMSDRERFLVFHYSSLLAEKYNEEYDDR